MNLSNSEINFLIEEWIHSERDRKILKRRLIDGITIEKLAEEMRMSVRQITDIVNKNTETLEEKSQENCMKSADFPHCKGIIFVLK